MDTVKIDIKSDEKASRMELFVRFFWAIPTYIVLLFLSFVAYICLAIQWILILVTGKRNMALNNWIKKFFMYVVKFDAYILLLTDERNPIMPED